MKCHDRRVPRLESHSRQIPCLRRGSWLIQTVITMTVMSVLMTIASTALFRMYRQQTLMVERTFQTSTWLRLNRDFRQDVHAATSIHRAEDGSQLELTTPDSRIIWITGGENARRIIPADDSPVTQNASASLPGEQYSFPDRSLQFVLASGENGARDIASIELKPHPTPNGGVATSNAVVAAVGLDHRFLASNSTSEEQP